MTFKKGNDPSEQRGQARGKNRGTILRLDHAYGGEDQKPTQLQKWRPGESHKEKQTKVG